MGGGEPPAAPRGRPPGGEPPQFGGPPPQLLIGQELLVDQIRKRRHRRAVEPGAEPPVDVRRARAATEPPVLVQVRGEDRLTGVGLERRRGGAVPPPRLAMALPAPHPVRELPPP